MNAPLVIAGLDPAIHTKVQRALRFIMDAADLGLVRGPNNKMPKSDISDLGFKPAHDEVRFLRGRAMNLHRHGRACPGHPRLYRWIDCQDVDARHEAGHDEYDVIGLIQSLQQLNRNRSFFSLPQASERSSFFRLLGQTNRRAKPFYLNQKVKR